MVDSPSADASKLFTFFLHFQLPADRCRQLLIDALCSILAKAKSGDNFRIAVLTLESPNTEGASSSVKGPEGTQFQPDDFHERLSIKNLHELGDVQKFYTDNFSVLSDSYGVLLFMYSVLMTKVSFFYNLCLHYYFEISVFNYLCHKSITNIS